MKVKDILIASAALVFIIIVTTLATHYLWKDKPGTISDKRDTVFTPHYIHDSIPADGKIKVVKIKDPVNIDSLWEEAKAYALAQIKKDSSNPVITNNINKDSLLSNYSYVAEIDTVYQDSLFIQQISFYSPIPIHPKSYFSINTSWIEREVIKTLMPKETVWKRFNWSLNGGFGYGLIKGGFDVYVGAGGSFNF